MRLALWMWLALAAIDAEAKIEFIPVALKDTVVMQLREDGNYDVVCANGNREVVTDLDLRLKNVCPNLKSSTPTEILSLQRRNDGNFDIVCRDFRKIVATEEEIFDQNVCSKPQIKLEGGRYYASEGYTSYYDQTISPTYEKSRLVGVHLAVDNGWTCDLACVDGICQDSGNCLSPRRLEVLSNTSYRFFSDGRNEAVFTKISN